MVWFNLVVFGALCLTLLLMAQLPRSASSRRARGFRLALVTMYGVGRFYLRFRQRLWPELPTHQVVWTSAERLAT